MAKNPQPAGALRLEIERRLLNGWCVYCRAPAAPDRPLTREHVIPRARGARRKDASLIVPACAPCNHHRGSREFILFLLARPSRIASFLAFLDSLPPECLGELDRRVIADLYAAVWLLCESTLSGAAAWRERLRRLCSGRRLHRRRYTARRVVGAVTARLDRQRRRTRQPGGPSCLIPAASAALVPLAAEHSLEELRAGLVTQLARLAGSPARRPSGCCSRSSRSCAACRAPEANVRSSSRRRRHWIAHTPSTSSREAKRTQRAGKTSFR